MKNDLIHIEDLSIKELEDVLASAKALKKNKGIQRQELKGKTIALLFTKPSNRTRVSFEVGINQLGGNCVYLSPQEIQLGARESVADVARTLSRYVDGIVARTHFHQDVIDLARFAEVPVINGLSDLQHPCQALADLLTIHEHLGKLKGVTVTYVGDGNNNVCHSLMLGCALSGAHIRVACPDEYQPQSDIIRHTQIIAKKTGSKLVLTRNPKDAVKEAQVVYADTFVSMGQEAEAKQRLKDFAGYQINKDLMKSAAKNHIFLHCLPAHRGQEVTEEVIDGPNSVIFDQAENRLHSQKAVLLKLLK